MATTEHRAPRQTRPCIRALPHMGAVCEYYLRNLRHLRDKTVINLVFGMCEAVWGVTLLESLHDQETVKRKGSPSSLVVRVHRHLIGIAAETKATCINMLLLRPERTTDVLPELKLVLSLSIALSTNTQETRARKTVIPTHCTILPPHTWER